MPENGEIFRVPAADNDPCFAGYAEAVILTPPEEVSCSFKDKTHFWQEVRRAPGGFLGKLSIAWFVTYY
jgi:hypothetical protein